MPRRLLLLLILVCVCPLTGAQRRADTRPAAAALSEILKPGLALQDRNGDGAIDFVNARIALSDNPSAAELAAASDIAARLGFETSALNLPLRGDDSAPVIFVGHKSLAGSGAALDAIGGVAGALSIGTLRSSLFAFWYTIRVLSPAILKYTTLGGRGFGGGGSGLSRKAVPPAVSALRSRIRLMTGSR